MPKLKDYRGQRHGMLLVTSEYRREYYTGGTNIYWLCICDCRNKIEVKSSKLGAGDSKSCGCSIHKLQSDSHKIHGKSKTPEYVSWNAMMARCYNPKSKDFKYYGGRGIEVCKEWHDFNNFIDSMGERPFVNASLEREDRDSNYETNNCRWASTIEQARNRKGVILDEDTVSIIKTLLKYAVPRKDIAKELNVSYSAISHIAQGARWKDVQCLPV